MHLKCVRAFSHERQQRAPSARFDDPLGDLGGENEAEKSFLAPISEMALCWASWASDVKSEG